MGFLDRFRRKPTAPVLTSAPLMRAMAVGGGHVAGARDRRSMRNWFTWETSANTDNSPDLPKLRTRSRDLVRNTPIATGAIATVVTNVVGDGLLLQSQIDREVLGLSQDEADVKQRQFEREFAIWARRPDFTGRLNFDGMQQLVLRAVLESGDCLIFRRRYSEPGDTYGLKLQVIEADRLSNPNRQINSPNMVDGVVLDGDGRPMGYQISSGHPGDFFLAAGQSWKYYEKGSSITGTPQILHLYQMTRPDQARGVPYLSPIIELIKQLGEYGDAEVRAALVSAMFTAFVKPQALEESTDPSFIGSNASGTNVDPDTEIALGNGAIVDLAPGEDVAFADPKRPNTAFDGFVSSICRQIGVGLQLPYEVLLKSFTASYSASRAALEMAWQFFSERRSWLAWNFCQPVYEWLITEAVASGRISAPGFFTDPVVREAWLGSDWVGPSRIQLDPQKEASADLIDLSMQTKTRAQIIAQRTGGSFEAKIAQLAKEARMVAEAGLATATSPSAALQPPQSGDGNGVTGNDGGGALARAQLRELLMTVRGDAAAPVINVTTPPISMAAPVINVAPAAVTSSPAQIDVHVHMPKRGDVVKTVTAYDEEGRIAEMTEREIPDVSI